MSIIEIGKKRRKGRSVQELIGIKRFTDYGLLTNKGEIIFFQVSPTNISVLSKQSIEFKIEKLKLLLSAIPDIEITCTDSAESFDNNKAYLHKRYDEEQNPKVKQLLSKDIAFLDDIQLEMSTARSFVFSVKYKSKNPEQVFQTANEVEKAISGEDFDIKRMSKADIKRYLGLYFGTSMNGEQMPDVDGVQYINANEGQEA